MDKSLKLSDDSKECEHKNIPDNKYKAMWEDLISYKSEFCKHEGTCFFNFLSTIKRSFLVGYTIRTGLNSLFALLSIKKNLKNISMLLYKVLLCEGDFRIPLFVTFMNSIKQLVSCLMRRVRHKDDGLNSFVSGFIGAFIGLSFENKKNWYTWRMYLGGRAIDMIYNSLVHRGIIKHDSKHFTIGFAICSALLAKGYFHEPQIIETDVFKLYRNFSQLGEPEKIWHICQVACDERKLHASLGKPFDDSV